LVLLLPKLPIYTSTTISNVNINHLYQFRLNHHRYQQQHHCLLTYLLTYHILSDAAKYHTDYAYYVLQNNGTLCPQEKDKMFSVIGLSSIKHRRF